MHRWLLPFALLLSLSGCSVVVDDSAFTILNDSDYTLYSVQVAYSDGRSWGDNLLGRGVLRPGDLLTVDRLDCDYYDARVVDEDDVVCEIYDVYVCFDEEVWVLTNATLDRCYREG